MKNLVVLLISLLFCIMTFLYSLRKKKRITNLEQCLLMFEQIETQICFFGNDVYGLIENISRSISLDFLNSFLNKNKNDSLSKRWESSLDDSKYKDCLSDDDINLLKSFGKMLGITDQKGQINNCYAHKKLLERELIRSKAESEKRGNLITTLGVIGSIGIIVLLI